MGRGEAQAEQELTIGKRACHLLQAVLRYDFTCFASMSGGSKGGIGNYIVDRPYGPSCHLAVPLARLLLGDRERCRQTRLSGHQVTMSGGSALQGTSVCVARAPIGARLPPLPAENLEISPPRRLIAPQIAYAKTPTRHTIASGARPHPPRESHHRPSRHLVVYGGRRY